MKIFENIHARILLFVAVGLIALGSVAGLAFARGKATPIGTGVVVIDTNLAYEDAAAAGTGMVLTSSGEILTNNHVIAGATTIKVVIPHTVHHYTARVVGYSVSSDVAVLQLVNAANLKTISLGNSSRVRVGQAVTALGNAGGTGSFTSATGTVTGLDKAITANNDQGGSEQLTGLIETNAGVQPGDSGGPLLDSTGKAIGMDTAASTSTGFQAASASDAYAIPIAKAVALAKQMVAGTTSATVHVGGTAFLGVQVEAVQTGGYGSGAGGGYGGSPATTSTGALIAGVVANGPAAKAGLTAGDVITAINGQAISSPTAITTLLQSLKPGATITVGYSDQNGESLTANATLASGPPQ
jgi:S1-C subfamily serine protease